MMTEKNSSDSLKVSPILNNAKSKASKSNLTLWYDRPAENFNNEFNSLINPKNDYSDLNWYLALPIGNGRLGGMVYGKVKDERIQLNEGSVWAGPPVPEDKKGARKYIDEARKLLFEGKYAEAEAIVQKHVISNWTNPRSYQTLGDLFISFGGTDEYEDYYRELDLNTAIASVTYRQGTVKFKREVFASAVDQVMVVHLTADKPGSISIITSLQRERDTVIETQGSDSIVIKGRASHHGEQLGVKFAAMVKADIKGGETKAENEKLYISSADSITLYLAAATDYSFDNPEIPLQNDLVETCKCQIAWAEKKPYDVLKAQHINEHQRLFGRVDFVLGDDSGRGLPLDKRLLALRDGADDPELHALYFQHGRYLLLCSSRPGSVPANLQGIWNALYEAAWNSDYHTNINIQMNYWLAQVTNLSECQFPYFKLIEGLRINGRKTAKDMYNCRGTVLHHKTDAWMFTAPTLKAVYGMWPTGMGWCARDFIEYYRFNGDKDFLQRRAYPLLKEASKFFVDWLVEDPKTGKLVSGPATSPENSFITKDGEKCSLCMGPAMEQEIIWETFSNFLEAARELEIKDGFTTLVEETKERLAIPRIASDGRLMEWSEEFTESEPGHRHISHLYAVHPGAQFTYLDNIELYEAARKSLEYRFKHGGGYTGWSRAWMINFFARFKDGEKSYENLQILLKKSTLPNLFDTHPPFQIDGNFGATSGIAEMLIQSHAGEIELLPALPRAWKDGHIKGMMARGGFEADIYWKSGKLDRAIIYSKLGKHCKIRFDNKITEFDTEAGKSYEISLN